MFSADEKMQIFLEGSKYLTWDVNGAGFSATNPCLQIEIRISRKQEEVLEFRGFKSHFSYELAIRKQNSCDYTYVRTGDYSSECDKLLKELYRTAQHSAQTSLLGDDLISTG